MADWIREKQIYYLSSENQLNENTNFFTANIQVPTDNRFNRITVMQVSIPISYWLIESGLNTFILVEGPLQRTITIPAGNYNQQSFTSVVAALLTSNSPHGLTYTITFEDAFVTQQTGLYTFTANSIAFAISFVFNSTNSINEQFGFDVGATAVFTPGATNSTLRSENVCQFVPENTVFIHSPLCGDENGDILQEVYNQSNPPFGYISWLNPAPLAYSKILKNNRVRNVSLSFSNERNLPIYFNGCNVTITLMLYRDNWDFYNMIANYIHFKLRSAHEEIMNAQTPELPAGISDETESEEKFDQNIL